MAKAKWHKLPAFTIPLFQSAHVYLATTREQFQHADKFLGGSGDEKPFNLGLARNYENTDTGERCYPNRMPVGSGNQLAKWNGWNYFHRKEPCDNGSE